MSHSVRYPVPDKVQASALINAEDFQALYQKSVNNPEEFWEAQAETFLSWRKKWTQVLSWDYTKGLIRWFDGGQINVCENCVDRHLETRADKTAIIWEGNEPGDVRTLTYRELHSQVCKFSNVLKKHGFVRIGTFNVTKAVDLPRSGVSELFNSLEYHANGISAKASCINH